ncbi:MAG: hypothetical protein RR662_07170 [Clostridia bacterium]
MNEFLKTFEENEIEIAKVENEISLAIADLQIKQKNLVAKNEELKEKIKLAMEENNTKKYETNLISITYVAETTRNTVDSAKLKANFEDIYNECLKTSKVKSNIRIKVKEQIKEEVKELETIKTDNVDLSDKF